MRLIMFLAIVLLLFGPSKLPSLGKGLGDAIRNMRAQIISPPSASSLSWEIGSYARFQFEERTRDEEKEEP